MYAVVDYRKHEGYSVVDSNGEITVLPELVLRGMVNAGINIDGVRRDGIEILPFRDINGTEGVLASDGVLKGFDGTVVYVKEMACCTRIAGGAYRGMLVYDDPDIVIDEGVMADIYFLVTPNDLDTAVEHMLLGNNVAPWIDLYGVLYHSFDVMRRKNILDVIDGSKYDGIEFPSDIRYEKVTVFDIRREDEGIYKDTDAMLEGYQRGSVPPMLGEFFKVAGTWLGVLFHCWWMYYYYDDRRMYKYGLKLVNGYETV